MYAIINERHPLNVKITMIDKILSFIAPHLCFGCNKLGNLLCENCKYDIVNDIFDHCLGCGQLTKVTTGVCKGCQLPYSRAWCVGERQGVLERLIDAYKFERTYGEHKVFAELFVAILPKLPKNVAIVSIPTIPAHIRQRGYDHTKQIAKVLAKQTGRRLASPLVRVTNTKQRDASRAVRITQAKQAFKVTSIDEDTCYLLVDDVVTTGATVKYAAKALRDAGAKDVWVAAIARQSLD